MIQFPDREVWNEKDRMIYFPVLIGGQILNELITV
ncbi:MAG: DUF1488 family protein [Symbiopectobacterium sp.]